MVVFRRRCSRSCGALLPSFFLTSEVALVALCLSSLSRLSRVPCVALFGASSGLCCVSLFLFFLLSCDAVHRVRLQMLGFASSFCPAAPLSRVLRPAVPRLQMLGFASFCIAFAISPCMFRARPVFSRAIPMVLMFLIVSCLDCIFGFWWFSGGFGCFLRFDVRLFLLC